jgi:hypothetical protein
VTPADLVAADGKIALTDELRLPANHLVNACRGQEWPFSHADYYRDLTKGLHDARDRVLSRLAPNRYGGLAEYRLAQRLGISREQLADVSFRLWQSTFSEERDRPSRT